MGREKGTIKVSLFHPHVCMYASAMPHPLAFSSVSIAPSPPDWTPANSSPTRSPIPPRGSRYPHPKPKATIMGFRDRCRQTWKLLLHHQYSDHQFRHSKSRSGKCLIHRQCIYWNWCCSIVLSIVEACTQVATN